MSDGQIVRGRSATVGLIGEKVARLCLAARRRVAQCREYVCIFVGKVVVVHRCWLTNVGVDAVRLIVLHFGIGTYAVKPDDDGKELWISPPGGLGHGKLVPVRGPPVPANERKIQGSSAAGACVADACVADGDRRLANSTTGC